jgi:large subunit ribosomal protein L21
MPVLALRLRLTGPSVRTSGWLEGSSVFAIIESGGRQLKVSKGSVVTVDHFDAEPGQEVSIDRVLVLEKDGGEVLAGAPFVADVRVLGVVDGESRGPKIRVFKKKRRKGMRRTKGHRSTYTRVRITDIVV